MDNDNDQDDAPPVNNTGRVADSRGGDFPKAPAAPAHPRNVMKVPAPAPQYVLTVTNPD